MKNIECKCKACGSGNVDLVTRIVGYFSKISFWNKSKLTELEARQKGNYKI